MKRQALMLAWLVATTIGSGVGFGQSPGPGVPNLAYPPEDLFQIIGSINGSEVPEQPRHGCHAQRLFGNSVCRWCQ